MSNQPYYPPTPPAMQSMQRDNGLGLTGFILGLIGLCFAPIPIIGVVAWPLVILGLVFSVIGMRRKGAKHHNKSIAGLVCSLIGLALCILWVAVIGSAASGANTYSHCVDRATTVEEINAC